MSDLLLFLIFAILVLIGWRTEVNLERIATALGWKPQGPPDAGWPKDMHLPDPMRRTQGGSR